MLASLLLVQLLCIQTLAVPHPAEVSPDQNDDTVFGPVARSSSNDGFSSNADIIQAALEAAQNIHLPVKWHDELIASHVQSVSRHVGPLSVKRPAQPRPTLEERDQHLSKRWWWMVTPGWGVALSAIGTFGSAMTGTVCALKGLTASLAGKISCWGLGALFGLLGAYGFGSAAVQSGAATAVLNGLVGIGKIVTGSGRRDFGVDPAVQAIIDCAGGPLSEDFLKTAGYWAVTALLAQKLQHCGAPFHNLADTLPGAPVHAGTNLTARYIDMALGHVRPLALSYPNIDGHTRIMWHEPHAQGFRQHFILKKTSAASLQRRELCEEYCDPIYGPGEGNPKCHVLCGPDSRDIDEQITYGYDFYGDSVDATEIKQAVTGDFEGLANHMNDVGQSLDNSGQNRACICLQNQNHKWVSTGEINVAHSNSATGDYSPCWAANCDGA